MTRRAAQAELDADIARMITIRRNRRELGWSYWGSDVGNGRQIGYAPMSSTERTRRHRAGQAVPRKAAK